MSKYRRLLTVILIALAAMVLSVFLFQDKVSAMDNQLAPQFSINYDILPMTSQRLIDLEQKTGAVAEQLESEKQVINELTSKLTVKQTEAELAKQRLEEIKNMFVHIDKYSFDSAGNNYALGNCTWYAKSKRPDISNSWGNANTWYANAKYQGWNVGSTPKKGAVATSTAGWGGHVAYVEGVSVDGQWATISEMNYGGLYRMNTRTVYYTEFSYIYELN